MSDREEEVQDYDYTKEIQQFKRIWKSYNNEGRQEIPNDLAKSPLNDSKSKTRLNNHSKDNKDKDRNAKTKTNRPVEPVKKQEPIKKDKVQSKQSPRSLTSNDEIHIQTRVAQNKLKSVQLGLGQYHNDPYVETKYRSSVKRGDDLGGEQLRRELEDKNQEIALLRISSNRYHDKISLLERQIQKRDNIIAQLRNEERKQGKQNNKGREKEWLIDFGQAEYESLKKDVRRLLQMLKNTQEYKQFATLAVDDGSIRFLHQANKKQKTNLDVQTNNLHFCTCNKAFISEPGLWVPENIYKFSKDFVRTRKGDLTNPELELMMYDLNKMWRQREKTIINSLNGIKAQQIGVLRRKIQNLTHKKQA